jgi:hypothetical protein
MSAEEARQLSEDANLNYIFSLIRKNAEEGHFEIHLNNADITQRKIKDMHFERLRMLGYTVTDTPQESFGEEFNTWTVTW